MPQRKITVLAPPTSLEELAQKVRAFVQKAKAPATLKAYRSDWNDFESWCRQHQLASLPTSPQTVALYITDCASTLKSASIVRRLTSITKAHQAAGYADSPASTHHFVVGETLKGIKRTIGTVQTGAEPLLLEDVRKIVRMSREDLLGVRDRALTLVGFAGAFRRSELALFTVASLTFSASGVLIFLSVGKEDEEGAGRDVAIPFGEKPETCPVLALKKWLQEARITSAPAPVFQAVDRFGRVSGRALHASSIGGLMKRAIARAGLDVKTLSAHSLRGGHCTVASIAGVDVVSGMRQSGHRTVASYLRYSKVRKNQLFHQNSASRLGL